MATNRRISPAKTTERRPRQPGKIPTWKLEDAKAKFSEIVRRAQDQGPQYVTVRGKPTVAIVDIAELQRWMPASASEIPLVDFLEGLDLAGLDIERERDLGRDPEL